MAQMFDNFTSCIENSGLFNGTNITDAVAATDNKMADPVGMLAFLWVLVIVLIFIIIFARAAMELIFLLVPSCSPSVPGSPLNNVKFVGHLKMDNSSSEKSAVQKQEDFNGVLVVST